MNDATARRVGHGQGTGVGTVEYAAQRRLRGWRWWPYEVLLLVGGLGIGLLAAVEVVILLPEELVSGPGAWPREVWGQVQTRAVLAVILVGLGLGVRYLRLIAMAMHEGTPYAEVSSGARPGRR